MELRNYGTTELRIYGTMDLRNYGIMELWNYGKFPLYLLYFLYFLYFLYSLYPLYPSVLSVLSVPSILSIPFYTLYTNLFNACCLVVSLSRSLRSIMRQPLVVLLSRSLVVCEATAEHNAPATNSNIPQAGVLWGLLFRR